MRAELIKLVKDTILLECSLPCDIRNIDKSIITDDHDDCYKADNEEDIVTIIYNAILDYSYSEFDITETGKLNMFSNAFDSKFKYSHDSTELAKQKLGVYGEVLLYVILHIIYPVPPLISRGYLYNPLEKSEAKGYDAYHLIERGDKTELWFGEVKFRQEYISAIKSVFDNIEKALSDKYLEKNLISITNNKSSINIKDSKIASILESWNNGGIDSLIDEIKKHNIKLVYPILLVYEKNKNGYDKSIEKAIDYINKNYSHFQFNDISVEFSVFFIFLPIKNVFLIKKEVIKWIDSKKPLL